MNIYLVRHGLTEWNKKGCYAGWSDPPLSPEGEAQAERLCRRFFGLAPFTLYSSDLVRAVSTAEIIGQAHQVAPVCLPAFRELYFGEWEGKSYGELLKTHPAELKRWYQDPFYYAPPGGETAAHLDLRVWAGLQAIIKEGRVGETIVLVSHGGPIRSIICRSRGLGPEQYWQIAVQCAAVHLLMLSGNGPEVPRNLSGARSG
jgi:alpha-ribazole phosphatase